MDRCDANLISWGSREDSWNAGSEPPLPRRLLKPFCPLPSAFPPYLTPGVQFWRFFQNRDRTPNKIIEPLTKVQSLCCSEKRIPNEALLKEYTQKLKLMQFFAPLQPLLRCSLQKRWNSWSGISLNISLSLQYLLVLKLSSLVDKSIWRWKSEIL